MLKIYQKIEVRAYMGRIFSFFEAADQAMFAWVQISWFWTISIIIL